MSQHDAGSIYHEPYLSDNYDAMSAPTENDEIIAHTLQEEFSQLAIREHCRYSHHEHEHYQEPDLLHDFRSQREYDLGNCCGHVESNNIRPSSSHSNSRQGDQCSHCLELTEEHISDCEVGNKLEWDRMTFIPHIPKTNGEVPSIDEATSDHQRLMDRLQLYDFIENKVQGDGNCQFRALSDHLYHTPEHHEYVRQHIVNQLRSHTEAYEGYVPMAYDDYTEKMSKKGEWGDHVTLQAAADFYGVRIFVMTSFKDTCCIEILPIFRTQNEIYLRTKLERRKGGKLSEGKD